MTLISLGLAPLMWRRKASLTLQVINNLAGRKITMVGLNHGRHEMFRPSNLICENFNTDDKELLPDKLCCDFFD
jgi:hypothetical protein